MRKIESLVVCLWILLYPILPRYFVFGKYPVYTYLTGIAFIFVFVISLLARKKNKVAFFVPILIGYIVLFIPYRQHGEIISYVRYFVETFSIFYIVKRYATNYTKFIKLIKYLCYSCFFLCLMGFVSEIMRYNVFSLFENASDFGSMGADSMIRVGILRLENSFGQPLSYALYLTLLSGIALFGIVYLKNKRFYTILYIFICANVILTVSRLPIFLFFMLQFLYCFVLPKDIRNRFITLSLVGIIVISVTFVLFDTESFSNFISMFTTVFNKGAGKYSTNFGANENPYEYREKLLEDIPIFFENYNISIWLGIGYVGSALFGRSIDNEYLFTALCFGIIGLIGKFYASVYTIISEVKNLFKIIKGKFIDPYSFLDVVFLLAIIIYLVNLVSVAQLDDFRIYNYVLALSLVNISLRRQSKS